MAKASPTMRSLSRYRKLGWPVCVVEKWVPQAGDWKRGKRIDAFGFGDLLVIAPHGIMLVQTTTGGDGRGGGGMAARITKIRTECAANAHAWLAAGGLIRVEGWTKRANGRYDCREEEIVEILLP